MSQSPHPAPRPLTTVVVCILTILAFTIVVATLFFDARHNRNVAEASSPYTPPSVRLNPQTVHQNVAFLGDSFTVGTGATSKSKRWTSVLSREKGWIELNYGLGGTNYTTEGPLPGAKPYHERLTDLIISKPDIVIVSSAGNALDENQKPGIPKTFEKLRKALPDARIIATSPYTQGDGGPDRLERFGDDVRAGVEAIDGEYLDIDHTLYNRPEAISQDEVHPNNYGYRLIADAVSAELD